jgi:hypothetical protein
MSAHECQVMIEMDPHNRYPAGIKARLRAEPAEVSLALRDRGWSPYRVWFDAGADAWIAAVTYRPDAA